MNTAISLSHAVQVSRIGENLRLVQTSRPLF
jgi:hypothetical protein